MATARERFEQRARDLGLAVGAVTFPAGTRTAAEAAAAIGCEVAQIVKSLVFVADGEPVLVLTSGANRVAPGKVAAILGAEQVRKADASEVRAATGYAIGGTPPVGHDQQLRTLMDRDLLGFDEVWAAAGTADSVFPLSPRRLLEVSRAVPSDVAEDA